MITLGGGGRRALSADDGLRVALAVASRISHEQSARSFLISSFYLLCVCVCVCVYVCGALRLAHKSRAVCSACLVIITSRNYYCRQSRVSVLQGFQRFSLSDPLFSMAEGRGTPSPCLELRSAACTAIEAL